MHHFVRLFIFLSHHRVVDTMYTVYPYNLGSNLGDRIIFLMFFMFFLFFFCHYYYSANSTLLSLLIFSFFIIPYGSEDGLLRRWTKCLKENFV